MRRRERGSHVIFLRGYLLVQQLFHKAKKDAWHGSRVHLVTRRVWSIHFGEKCNYNPQFRFTKQRRCIKDALFYASTTPRRSMRRITWTFVRCQIALIIIHVNRNLKKGRGTRENCNLLSHYVTMRPRVSACWIHPNVRNGAKLWSIERSALCNNIERTVLATRIRFFKHERIRIPHDFWYSHREIFTTSDIGQI